VRPAVGLGLALAAMGALVSPYAATGRAYLGSGRTRQKPRKAVKDRSKIKAGRKAAHRNRP
jgi:hypothetical protein